MTTLHTAARQALDALLNAVPCTADQVEEQAAAIEALRAALARPQAQPEPFGYLYDWVHSSATGKPDEAFTSFTEDKSYAEKHANARAIYLAAPQPPAVEPAISADAYEGAREDLAIWKKRALEAEAINRKFIAEVNGPTHMGEPPIAQPAKLIEMEVGKIDATIVFVQPDGKRFSVLGDRVTELPAPQEKSCATCVMVDPRDLDCASVLRCENFNRWEPK